MNRQEDTKKKKSPLGTVIAILLIVIAASPEEGGEVIGVLLGIALCLLPVLIPLGIWLRRRNHRKEHQSALEDTTYGACRQEKAFNERNRSRFCIHDDKAIHHVARGKEVDPWDRPDIDISKYQKRR